MNTVGITYFITMRSLEWTKNEHSGYYILHNNEELGVWTKNEHSGYYILHNTLTDIVSVCLQVVVITLPSSCPHLANSSKSSSSAAAEVLRTLRLSSGLKWFNNSLLLYSSCDFTEPVSDMMVGVVTGVWSRLFLI